MGTPRVGTPPVGLLSHTNPDKTHILTDNNLDHCALIKSIFFGNTNTQIILVCSANILYANYYNIII